MFYTNTSIYNKPSFYALLTTGIIILLILIQTYRGAPINQLKWLFLFSILVGIHGILHHILEINYGYNPIQSIQNYFA